MVRMKKALPLVLALLAPPPAAADVRLPRIFGDHMVLQRETVARLHGWAAPGEVVTVAPGWSDRTYVDTAEADGTFAVELPTPEAGGPYSLAVRGANEIVLSDVLIGEVWVCSGQSNMEWTLAPGVGNGILNWEDEVRGARWPRIRGFLVEHAVARTPQTDCSGRWSACSPDTVGAYSAVAYFFGRALHRELDVPIGLVMTSWGGTPAEAWTSARALRALGGFDEQLDRIEHDPGPTLPEREAAWWAGLGEHDPGTAAGWERPAVDDADWGRHALPGIWEERGLEHDGVVWYRRTVELPDDWAGSELRLELGAIDDMDSAWFEGARVGGLEHNGTWTTARDYRVPAALVRPGPATIAVRVVDTGGAGGITARAGRLRLAPVDRPADAIALDGEWRVRAGAALDELPEWPRPWFHARSPTALSNGMLAPLERVAIRGAIWYQGEANVSDPEPYGALFPALIADWRRRFGRGDFPFYFVQLAPYRYGGDDGRAALVRDAQRRALRVPNTGMAVTLDVGNPDDIHPLDKQSVGWRLALWALDRTYGRDVGPVSGPLYRAVRFERGAARLAFDHAADGLVLRAGEPVFELRGADGSWEPASASIEGRELVLRGGSAAPTAARYAWGAADEARLFNSAGLPAASFTTAR